MKEKIILSEEISKSFAKLGFKENLNPKIMAYFLEKNCQAIFGKNVFDSDEVEFTTRVFYEEKVDEITKKSILIILYANNEYCVEYNLYDQTLNMVYNNCNYFSIKQNKNNANITNQLVTSQEDKVIKEIEEIGWGRKPYFDYKKIVSKEDGEILSSSYNRLIPLNAKIKKKEFFSLIHFNENENEKEIGNLNGSLSKRFKYYLNQIRKQNINEKMIGINTSYELFDLYDYLKEIYAVLEKEADVEDYTRKLKK